MMEWIIAFLVVGILAALPGSKSKGRSRRNRWKAGGGLPWMGGKSRNRKRF